MWIKIVIVFIFNIIATLFFVNSYLIDIGNKSASLVIISLTLSIGISLFGLIGFGYSLIFYSYNCHKQIQEEAINGTKHDLSNCYCHLFWLAIGETLCILHSLGSLVVYLNNPPGFNWALMFINGALMALSLLILLILVACFGLPALHDHLISFLVGKVKHDENTNLKVDSEI